MIDRYRVVLGVNVILAFAAFCVVLLEPFYDCHTMEWIVSLSLVQFFFGMASLPWNYYRRIERAKPRRYIDYTMSGMLLCLSALNVLVPCAAGAAAAGG